MSRQFSGSNLWLDLPLNLLQAQSTVSRAIDTLTPIISPPCRGVCFPTDAPVSAVMRAPLPPRDASDAAYARPRSRHAGETGFTLTENSTDTTHTHTHQMR